MCAAAAAAAGGPGRCHPVTGRLSLSLRWSTLVGLTAWAAVSLTLIITVVPPRTPRVGLLGGGDDFDAYRDGVEHVLRHLPLYSDPLIHQHFYTYPPFSVLAFMPFALLPYGADTDIWLGINLVVVIAIVALCWRMLGYRITGSVLGVSTLLAVIAVFLEPVRSTLLHGQINLVLMLLVLADTSLKVTSRVKGIGVGLAAGIKLVPGYFVFYYLALRQWRPVAIALATLTATVAVGFARLPNDSRRYWSGEFAHSARIADDFLHPSNQTLRGAIARVLGGHPASATGPMSGKPAPTWVWLLAAAVVMAASLWIVVRLHRAGEQLLAVTLTGLTATVVSPFAWTHHWVWFLPLLVDVVHRALANRWWWLCALALFVVLGSWPYRFPADERPRIGLYMFPDRWVPWLILANLYVLVCLALLIVSAAAVMRHRADRSRDSN